MNDWYNRPLAAAVLAWVLAQVIKTLFYRIKTGKFSAERILGSGGMPSSHSAAVVALTVVILKTSGADSAEFGLAALFALITMYDATGVRRAAGLHAKALNRIMRQNDPNIKRKDLKEFLGHSPLEVLCGVILGVVVGVLF